MGLLRPVFVSQACVFGERPELGNLAVAQVKDIDLATVVALAVPFATGIEKRHGVVVAGDYFVHLEMDALEISHRLQDGSTADMVAGHRLFAGQVPHRVCIEKVCDGFGTSRRGVETPDHRRVRVLFHGR